MPVSDDVLTAKGVAPVVAQSKSQYLGGFQLLDLGLDFSTIAMQLVMLNLVSLFLYRRFIRR